MPCDPIIAADTPEGHIVRQYREREIGFFRGLSPAHLKMLRMHHIDPADSLLYGEFAFVLLGLKPCMLVDFPRATASHESENIMQQYRKAVLDPLVDQVQGLCISEIDRSLASAEMDIKGCLLVTKTAILDSVVQQLRDHDEQEQVSETLLAKALDYPGRLPESSDEIDTMHEVVYYALPSKTILTTFAAQHDELGRVREHFDRYKELCQQRLGMQLGLLVRQPGC